MKKTHSIHTHAGLGTLGQQVEARFDELDADLGHIRPRDINVYNQIVWMTKLLKEARSR